MTARENVSNNPYLEILLRTLWAYKWEDSIIVITDEYLRREAKKDYIWVHISVSKKMHEMNSTN